jgi:uncharacterized protein YjbI with pentapeptide repeats
MSKTKTRAKPNQDHVQMIKLGASRWNRWRKENPAVSPDLRGATLSGLHLDGAVLSGGCFTQADLSNASLRGADLTGANLSGAKLVNADMTVAKLCGADMTTTCSLDAILENANLEGADLSRTWLGRGQLEGAYLRNARLVRTNLAEANLYSADLSEAVLDKANLSGAHLNRANLNAATLNDAHLIDSDLSDAEFIGAHLNGADLSNAKLIRTNFTNADLKRVNFSGAFLLRTILDDADITGSQVYGVSVWDVRLKNTTQGNLLITAPSAPVISVDNLEVAQFIHLLLNNKTIRHVIDTITSKVVLILGRFTPERQTILDAIRDELRKRDYLPVLFDFEKPSNRDITETVSTLAHMARFVIADLSDPKSIPHELAHVAPLLPSVPIMPLIVRPQKEYAMFEHFFGFGHVLKPFRYRDETHLLSVLNDKIIVPAETLAQRIAGKRSRK